MVMLAENEQTKYILVVEDNKVFNKVLLELLNSRLSGVTVEGVKYAQDALQKSEERFPDIFFIDIKLPDMNGIMLMQLIRERYPQASPCFIVLTSYDVPEYEEAARQNGVTFFFSKGIVSNNRVIKTVKGILSGDPLYTRK